MFSCSFNISFRFNDLNYDIMTLVIRDGSFLLTPLPPWPSKTANKIDLGQLGRKQSIINEATYDYSYYPPCIGDEWD